MCAWTASNGGLSRTVELGFGSDTALCHMALGVRSLFLPHGLVIVRPASQVIDLLGDGHLMMGISKCRAVVAPSVLPQRYIANPARPGREQR